jgi:RimJ/RimL family protein N-acetyltransferase
MINEPVARPAAPTALKPYRRSRHVDLFGLHPSLYPMLHAELMVRGVSDAWRARGRFIASHDFERFLTQGIQRSAVAVRRGDQRLLVGLLELLDLQLLERRAEVAVAATPDVQSSGLILEAAALFFDDCLTELRLEKLYMNMAAESYTRLASAFNGLLTVEGVLRDYLFVSGRLQDVTVASLTRERFAEWIDEHLGGWAEGGWRILMGPGAIDSD